MIFTMAKKSFTIEVGRTADDATIRHFNYGFDVEFEGVESSVLVGLVTPGEIAEEVDLPKMLKALVRTHGLGEVIYSLVENNDTTEIIKEIYEADDDAVRSWVSDTFSDNE